MLDRPVTMRHRAPPSTPPPRAGRSATKGDNHAHNEIAGTAAAVAAAAALALTAEATASTPPRSETLSFMDASSTSQVFGVIATGAFTDAGTILINGPGKLP